MSQHDLIYQAFLNYWLNLLQPLNFTEKDKMHAAITRANFYTDELEHMLNIDGIWEAVNEGS